MLADLLHDLDGGHGATPTPFSRNRSRYVAEKQSLFVSSLPLPSRGMSDACSAPQDMEQASVAAVPKSLGDASGRGTPSIWPV